MSYKLVAKAATIFDKGYSGIVKIETIAKMVRSTS